jgi:membrane protease YdiL (CAAX protease family)
MGLRFDRGAPLDLLVGLTLGALQMALVFGVEWANGWLSVRLFRGAELVHGLIDAAIAFALFVLVAVGEELMFRGYLQTNLQEGSGSLVALLVTSVTFATFHALNPNLRWMAVLNLALAGLALGYGRLVTGGLWLPIAYHFSWNYCQGAVLGLPVSGVRYGGLLAVTDQGAVRWLTGTSFGPEGGLVGTVILLSAFPVYWLWGRFRRRLVPIDPSAA